VHAELPHRVQAIFIAIFHLRDSPQRSSHSSTTTLFSLEVVFRAFEASRTYLRQFCMDYDEICFIRKLDAHELHVSFTRILPPSSRYATAASVLRAI
jgi:hypothetical protein